MRRRRSRVVASLVLAIWMASPVSVAGAFGTIDSGGQQNEHQRITRAALACAGEAGSEENCFGPASIDFLAGHDKEFGGVGAPDSDEISDPAAHCDDADFLEEDYPQTREQATTALMECVDHLRMRLGEAVDDAAGLLDDDGQIIEDEVDFGTECRMREARREPGQVRHPGGFRSSAPWSRRTSTRTATGPTRRIPRVPSQQTTRRVWTSPRRARCSTSAATQTRSCRSTSTGCYVLQDEVPRCRQLRGPHHPCCPQQGHRPDRPRHRRRNRPHEPRGMVEENFAKAVAGAIDESRRQWEDLRRS